MDNSGLLDIVPTKAAAFKKNTESQYKAIVFETHKPKQLEEKSQNNAPQSSPRQHDRENSTKSKNPNQNVRDDDGPEFDMKKARHEIMRFGISGLRTKNKKKAEIALAVKLGAIPPKKVYRNYKDLLHQKKATQKQKEENRRLRQLGKNQTGAAVVRYKKPKLSKKKKDVGELSRNYGVIKQNQNGKR